MGLTYSSVVSTEPDEVFAWHSRPGAVTRLMPPWQPVRVAREAPSVRAGTRPGARQARADARGREPEPAGAGANPETGNPEAG
jgi:hypothetical protein